MPLPWIRYDTTHPWNPKVLSLVEDGKWRAIAVYDFSLAYCGAQDTDGFIPRLALASIHGTPRVATDLVNARLWATDRKGWYIPDFTDYQPTSEKTAETRAQKQAASRKGNCIRWHGIGCNCWREVA